MVLVNFNNKNAKNVNDMVLSYIDKLDKSEKLSKDDFLMLLDNINYETFPYLQNKAYNKCREVYNDSVFIRGLIEITNYCIQDCYYCGIRKSNEKVVRYRYDKKTILDIIEHAYKNGYRTIVMQGGEDLYYDDNCLIDIVSTIRKLYPSLAITLSLGERTTESYRKLHEAGTNRFLLRHESASDEHYQKLHPDRLLKTRMRSLYDLKSIGYQTGAGFMVDSPYQGNNDLVNDLLFIQDFQPEMIGIGPYLTHPDTPFNEFANGDINHVLVCYALARLICPKALIPSTTATSSLDSNGRYLALMSGCNVIMINLSPVDKRKNYSLYANKTYAGDESQAYLDLIKKDIEKANLKIDFNIGNYKKE